MDLACGIPQKDCYVYQATGGNETIWERSLNGSEMDQAK